MRDTNTNQTNFDEECEKLAHQIVAELSRRHLNETEQLLLIQCYPHVLERLKYDAYHGFMTNKSISGITLTASKQLYGFSSELNCK
jgi:hypothetical protein